MRSALPDLELFAAVARNVSAGQLLRVLQAWSPGIAPPYLYYSRQRSVPTLLRAFIDLAREETRTA